VVSCSPLPAARKPSLSGSMGPGCKSLLRHCQCHPGRQLSIHNVRPADPPSRKQSLPTPTSPRCWSRPATTTHCTRWTDWRAPRGTQQTRVAPTRRRRQEAETERVNERARVGVRVRRERGSWRGLGTRRLVLHRLLEGFRRRRPGILTSTSRRQHRDQTEILYNTTTNQPFQNEENHNA
jgi:hypothetical protein